MGEGKENRGGRIYFTAPNKISKTVLNIKELNIQTLLNPCLAFGLWVCVSRLAKEKMREKTNKYCQLPTASLSIIHRGHHIMHSTTSVAKCVGRSTRQQVLPLDKTVSEGIYSCTGLQKNHFGSCKPTFSAICT